MQRATLHVQDTCRHIEHEAKMGVPVRKPGRGEPPGGALRASLGTDITHRGYVVRGKVGSKLRYAHVVHNGAKRHKIRAKHAPMLSFYWDKAPAWMVTKTGPYAGKVRFKSVNHPGMKGNRYLTTPLKYWGFMRGFKVYTKL